VIEHGDSGGPVFAAGTQKIIAVNSGAGSGIEVLARVDLLRSWIAARVASTGAAAPPPPPPPPPPPAADAGASPPPPTASCAASEAEPNDTFATEGVLKTTACGKLDTSADVDWYAFAVTVGQTTVSITGDADASASIGYVNGGKCIPALANVRAASVTLATGTASLCIAVSSPSHKVQAYRLVAVH
jgi:hypothetical protein